MITKDTTPEAHIMREITPLSERDCFYIVDRRKVAFDYPLHIHEELELNFIEHAAGARRIVGDSAETIGEYELVLIAGPELEHGWEQGDCRSRDIREITIQFSAQSLPDVLLQKNQFDTIRRMLERARHGLAFPMDSIMKVYARLERLAHDDGGFHSVLAFLEVLYELSLSEGARELSSSAFSRAENRSESRRVAKVQQYIAQHFHEEVRLETLADLVGMTPVGFSRFFRQRTGRTLSDYIIDTRIGHAARLLVDSTQTVAEICYDCGFNTLSNFNRLFRRRKGCSPKEFREGYQKKKVFI
ncbi:MAG: helix-turn-helix domain-containing protein [Bacteroidaceae bacterium]|nr:helix-turn-helix domain-containing protein [Bacteroidaceae bacterium]